MKTLRYEQLFPDELEEEISHRPVAFIPLGTLEWHGWHLALGTDAIKAHAICHLTAARTGGVVLPPLFFGTDQVSQKDGELWIGMDLRAGQKLAGSCYYLPPDLFGSLIQQISRNLIRQGFKILVLLTGHYPAQQRNIIKQVAEDLAEKHPVKFIVLAEFELVKDLGYTGDHAGEWETSILMALEPRFVEMGKFEIHTVSGDHLLGVHGDPAKASAETGDWIVNNMVQRLAERIDLLLNALA
jgi:creatinine amidohydrolase